MSRSRIGGVEVFNTIVVGVDGHEGGRDALALADSLRRLFGGELVAVHAYSFDPLATRGVTPDLETVIHANASDLVQGELDRTHVAAEAVAKSDGVAGACAPRRGEVAQQRADRRRIGSARAGRPRPGGRRYRRDAPRRVVSGRRPAARVLRARR
jgi:hypothetical protein